MCIWNEFKASILLLVAMLCHSIVNLGRQDCPPAIWLRALSKVALINESTPIPYSSPTILIKSQKIYNKERRLYGHDHKLVRMRRTGAIPHMKIRSFFSVNLGAINLHEGLMLIVQGIITNSIA